MRANLLIQEDAQLRKEIRKMVEAHVKAVAEGDLKKLLIDAVSKYQLDKKYISELIDKEVTRQIAKALSDNNSFSNPNYSKVRKAVEDVVKTEVDRAFPNMQSVVNRYIALKVDAGMTTEIRDQVNVMVDKRMAEVFKGLVARDSDGK